MEEEEDGIQEMASSGGASARLARSESRWVDGSEVDSAESPPWCEDVQEPTRTFSGGGSMRRRLGKKPKRVDSLDEGTGVGTMLPRLFTTVTNCPKFLDEKLFWRTFQND